MSRHRENFKDIVDAAVNIPGNESLRPVITKEILHYDILSSLDREGFLSSIVFQGGTSLRLCRGSRRFSEDLDFAGGVHFDAKSIMGIGECIQDYIVDRYGLSADVKSPALNRDDPAYLGLNVDRWQVSIVTDPGHSNVPKQRIKLEVVNVPALTSELKPLMRNYDFLSPGAEDVLVRCETSDEILADKVVSFVNCQDYIRYRDLWDLAWLSSRGARLDIDMVSQKISHYGAEGYRENLEERISSVADILSSKPFLDHMSRFLSSSDVQGYLMRPAFTKKVEETVTGLLEEAKAGLYADMSLDSPSDPFSGF